MIIKVVKSFDAKKIQLRGIEQLPEVIFKQDIVFAIVLLDVVFPYQA